MVAQRSPLNPPVPYAQFVEKDGKLTNSALSTLQQWREAINGLTPLIPCTATVAANVYTLAPYSIVPVIEGYKDFYSFGFVSPGTSTGAVTALVNTPNNPLATINVYKTRGSAQAGNLDITINLFYIFFYISALNSGAGGFVII